MTGQREGLVIWITGLPGAGKSTLAEQIKKTRPGFHILRMDELRRLATPEPKYSETERDMLYRALVFTAKTLSGLGHDVIMDATGNLRIWRELARSLIPRYIEVYLRCPIEVCEKREGRRLDTLGAPRAIYEKAESGWPVPGLSAPYEEPLNPELALDADRMSPDEELGAVMRLIEGLT